MTHIEENIVNIAMKAGELLKSGKIDPSNHGGHMALTTDIVWMAGEFEHRNAHVDWNTSELDYWEEIDSFAEEGLTETFGIEQSHEDKPLDIKVIFDEGIVHAVLKNQNLPVHVEVVDIDPDYEDYKQLDAYRKELYNDSSFSDCDFTVARFDLEPERSDAALSTPGEEGPQIAPQTVSVVAALGSTKLGQVFSGTWDECVQFCEDNQWTFLDANSFAWGMKIQDPLELALPEGFYLAVDYFSNSLGMDIHNGFVRQHADELVFCHKNSLSFNDFDSWARYETLLGEKLSFGEYTALERHFHGDPNDIAAHDTDMIHKLKGYLEGFRCERKAVLSLDEQILKADDQRLSLQQTTAPKRNTEQQR